MDRCRLLDEESGFRWLTPEPMHFYPASQQARLFLFFLGFPVLPFGWSGAPFPGRMVCMGQSAEFGKFLKAMRSRLSPEVAGTGPSTGARRVPGLRREEVARLAANWFGGHFARKTA